jgi:hypothetical protein
MLLMHYLMDAWSSSQTFFFEDVPVAGKDIYYSRHIIHNWPDTEATAILRNIRAAMGPSSVVLIHDCVLFHTFQELGIGTTDGLSIAPEPMLPNFGTGSHSVPNRPVYVVPFEFKGTNLERTEDYRASSLTRR